MKKFLLGLAMFAGFACYANAETVTLNIADAKDIVGTLLTSGNNAGNYDPIKSFSIGDFKFSGTYDESKTSSAPKLWNWSKGSNEQLRLYGSGSNQLTVSAPEGYGITNLVFVNYSYESTSKVKGNYSSEDGTISYPEKEGANQETFNVAWTSTEPKASATLNAGGSSKGQFTSIEVTYQKEASADPVDLSTLIDMMFPADDTQALSYWTAQGVKVEMFLTGGVTVNTACKENAKMTLDGALFGEEMTAATVNSNADFMDDETDLYFWPIDLNTGEDFTAPKPGTYTFTIPEGFLSYNGAPVAAYTRSWVIEGSTSDGVALESVAEVYPNTSSSAQSMWTGRGFVSVDLTFNEPSKAALNTACKESITMTLNGAPFGSSLSVADAELDTRWGEMSFLPGGDLKNGEYVLTIPEGFFTYDGKPVALYTASYTISGIKEPLTLESVMENILPSDDEEAAEMWAEDNITIQMLINGDIKITYDVDANGVDSPITLSHGDEQARIWDYMADGKIIITDPAGEVNPLADDGVQKLVVLKFPVKAESGDYELSIPSGFFTIDGQTLGGYTKSWTIAAPAPVSFESILLSVLPDNSPDADKEDTAAELWASGEVKTQFVLNETVTVNSASTDKVTMTLNGKAFGLALDAASPYIQILGDFEPLKTRAATTNLAMVFNPDVADDATLAPGEYTLNIPEGFFKAGNNLLSAYTCTWTVAGQNPPAEVSFAFTPADGEVVTEELEDILVNVTGAANVALAADSNMIVLTKGEETVKLVGIVFGQEIDYMIINPLADGEWTATIPANSIILDGTAYAKELTWKFTINDSGSGNEEVKPVITPAAGEVNAEQLATVTLTFPEDAVVVPAEEDMYMVMITPAKPTSGFGVAYTIDYEASKDNVIVLKYGGVIDDMVTDTWTLNIGANTYKVNGVANAAYDVVYAVTAGAVAGIFADAESINAYTINGVAVILNGTADDLRQLPAGIYVINGTKVIIRK